jgi:hypothetical protein
MELSGGIEFWISDKGRVRLFTVTEPDKTKAQKLLQRKYPTMNSRLGTRCPPASLRCSNYKRAKFSNGLRSRCGRKSYAAPWRLSRSRISLPALK